MTREEAIRRIKDHFRIHDDGRPTPYLDEAVAMAIEALSRERPKGRWNPISADRVRCTNCDAIRDITTQLFWDFCPNCGADMRGEEE